MSERGRPRGFDRDAALERAMEVFEEKGYDGASMADLTKAMGINSPSLYAAFGCKEALFREAVDLYASRGAAMWAGVPASPTAKAGVAHLLRESAMSFTSGEKPRGCLIVLGALHEDDSNSPACRMLQEHRAGNLEALRERLEHAVEEGELPAGLDCRAVAAFYMTVQQGMSFQARDGASRETLLGIAESAMAGWESLTMSRALQQGD
ncbi:TetR/AcrR family transcriptional regulator [Phyllobacterium salinisoli]|uniref:TetR/AcrR family transcriptional regulator n=1 Tax=Phyllobacterium salinisoli TaxID=1899321 RepID=A0A368K2L4_9HYPH|nr:TetR/AcrR family transcriptional regulator [Phyllobacterium salinisoli]RCS23424.1 TetR/AcrR family transcriptional regulator [Phyllobacterium salinisoli]